MNDHLTANLPLSKMSVNAIEIPLPWLVGCWYQYLFALSASLFYWALLRGIATSMEITAI